MSSGQAEEAAGPSEDGPNQSEPSPLPVLPTGSDLSHACIVSPHGQEETAVPATLASVSLGGNQDSVIEQMEGVEFQGEEEKTTYAPVVANSFKETSEATFRSEGALSAPERASIQKECNDMHESESQCEEALQSIDSEDRLQGTSILNNSALSLSSPGECVQAYHDKAESDGTNKRKEMPKTIEQEQEALKIANKLEETLRKPENEEGAPNQRIRENETINMSEQEEQDALIAANQCEEVFVAIDKQAFSQNENAPEAFHGDNEDKQVFSFKDEAGVSAYSQEDSVCPVTSRNERNADSKPSCSDVIEDVNASESRNCDSTVVNSMCGDANGTIFQYDVDMTSNLAATSDLTDSHLSKNEEINMNASVSLSDQPNTIDSLAIHAVTDLHASKEAANTDNRLPQLASLVDHRNDVRESTPIEQEDAESSKANQQEFVPAVTNEIGQTEPGKLLEGIIKTEAASHSTNCDTDAINDEADEAARQAASWIADASEAASAADPHTIVNGSLEATAAAAVEAAARADSAITVPKLEPMALLEAKTEPVEPTASTSDRKPVGVNGSLSSPVSHPCSSSASALSSQLPVVGCKTFESSLTKRQRHDLELIGTCPRCEKFREQVVFDENNEPQPGVNILPDYLANGLDMVVIGINPSITSAYVGHHYAGPGNHFWSCVSESGLIAEQLTCHDDHRITEFGIGFTNVCTRPTKGAAELTRKEMKEGAEILLAKLKKYKPRIAVFNGKGIYEAFVGNKNFYMGKQPEPLPGTDIVLFVMPSSSARCAQLPRAADKLPFYTALRKLRDYVVGLSSHLNDADVVFTDYTEMRVTQPDPKSIRKAERRRKRKAELAAAAERNVAAAAAAAAAGEARETVPVKIAALQQPHHHHHQHHHQHQQQQQTTTATTAAAAAATALLRSAVKVEATSTGPISTGQQSGTVAAGAAAPQYALLTQQPGHYEWQIYQPTLYYQLAAPNPGDQTGTGGTAAATAAAAYLRPQLQILPDSAAQLADGQSLGFANVLLLDPSQLAAATAGAAVPNNVALVPSTVAAAAAGTTTQSQAQSQQHQQNLTYTTL